MKTIDIAGRLYHLPEPGEFVRYPAKGGVTLEVVQVKSGVVSVRGYPGGVLVCPNGQGVLLKVKPEEGLIW